MNKVLIAIAATIFTSTAFASNWVKLGENLYVDTESIQRSGPISSLWMRANYGPHIKEARSWIGLIDANCSKREIRLRYSVSYELPDRQGKSVKIHRDHDPFTPVAPDTNEELLYQYLCNK